MEKRFARQNGVINLDLGWKGAWEKVNVYGGPFHGFPQDDPEAFGVCLKEEAPKVYDVHLPIPDFGVPDDDFEVAVALSQVYEAAFKGKAVYAGCGAGWGRTGLFLALVAKVAGVPDPITYVRENYTPQAVETAHQEAYVRSFDVGRVRLWVYREAWTRRFFGSQAWIMHRRFRTTAVALSILAMVFGGLHAAAYGSLFGAMLTVVGMVTFVVVTGTIGKLSIPG
jgi:hypothetical protein